MAIEGAGPQVDPEKPVRFVDDRSKSDADIVLEKVLYRDENVCLGLSGDSELGEVLFRLEDGEVLTSNLEFWYAENF